MKTMMRRAPPIVRSTSVPSMHARFRSGQLGFRRGAPTAEPAPVEDTFPLRRHNIDIA